MPIVAGGGLSGLSAAYYLTRKYRDSGLKLLLLEASKRCGGWVDSDRRSDFLFEAGPRTIRIGDEKGINTLNLIEEIGISDRVVPIPRNHVAARNRMIYANGELCMLPNSIYGAFVTKKPFSRPLYKALVHDLTAKPLLDIADDTIYNFTRRRFGKDIADYAISSMICGICAGDAKEISVKFLMSALFEMEQKHGGVVKGLLRRKKSPKPQTTGGLAKRSKSEKWSIYSIDGGLEELPKKILDNLAQQNINVYTDHRIQEISFYNDNKKVNVKIKDDYAFCSDHLFSCLPSYELGNLLENSHPRLASELKDIPFVDVAVVNLQYDSNKLLKHDAFGFLVPPLEKLPILGVIFDSCCFPKQKGTVLTVMMGGKWFKKYLGENPADEQILDIATDQIGNILNIKQKPDMYKVNVLRKCIPQYIVGHHGRIERIRKYIKDNNLPLSLCGSSYDGVGVNDVIYSSKIAVENTKLM